MNNLFFRLDGHWRVINLIALHCFTVTTSNPVSILPFYFMVTTAEYLPPEIDHRGNSGRLTSTIRLVLTAVTWLQSVNQYFLTQVLRAYSLEGPDSNDCIASSAVHQVLQELVNYIFH